MQVLSGILLRPRRASCTSPRPTWSSRCAARSTRRSRATARSSSRAARCSTSSRLLPGERGRRSSTGREEGVARDRLRLRELPAAHVRAEDFPRLPERRAATSFHGRARGAARDGRARQPRRVARRVAPGADRHPRPLRGRQVVMAATDSYRLAVKETRSAATLPELEAIIPARALAELARIAGRRRRARSSASRRTRSSSAPTARWLTTRRIDGQFPNYRQLLPDAVRARADAAARRAARRRPPRRR